MKFEVGQTVVCINDKVLADSGIKPPLTEGDQYIIESIAEDSDGNQHLDVGLPSEFNYIRSMETGEELEGGDEIHWCHPSRFNLVEA